MTHGIRLTPQRGSLLLEGLIGILLFSIGILAVVALQGSAVKEVSQAKYRSDASFLADQLIGQIWANRTNAATYAYNGSGTAPTVLNSWMQQVTARLPNSGSYPPKVAVTTTAYAGPPAYTAYQVKITLSWQTPEEYNSSPKPPPHSMAVSTVVTCC
jgi:type IV pilus assembly protein PilV